MRKGLSIALALSAALGGFALLNGRRTAAMRRRWQTREAEIGPGTAFITGASSGIGAAFARALARQGYRLVLLARREDRLKALAEELRAGGAGDVRILAADLSDPEAVERAAQVLAEIPDLTLLINNAGFGTGGRFDQVDVEPELRMIQVHAIASVRLTRAALPGMIARGHGGVINVSSIAGLLPMPGNTIYGATKSFLIFFTGSMNSELAGSGVRVQALCPGFTYSEFHDVMGVERSFLPRIFWMEASDVVKESLRGLRTGQEIVIPGAGYRVLAFFIRLPLSAPLARLVQRYRLKLQGWKGF